MADFIAVESGNQSAGYLVVNGNVYPAVSGTSKLLDVPEGKFTYGNPEALSKKQYRSMTDGSSPKNFSKFHIGTGPGGSGDIKDSRRVKPREGIEFHYDGGNPGTAGCIGYQDNAARAALIADPNKTVTVQHVKSLDEAKALAEQKLGHKVDWSKVKAPRTGGGGGGSGTHSKNRKGRKVKKANKTVLLGPKHRHTAHRQALLEGGVQIAQASRTVFVGPERLGVARVDDLTTDGSPIADGESSILVG